jgi:hypothetical protein
MSGPAIQPSQMSISQSPGVCAIHRIMLLATLAGCCTHWIDTRAFRASSLAEQIPEFERARREHCIPRENFGLLITGMASHGREAAAAMIEFLSPSRPPRILRPEDWVLGGSTIQKRRSVHLR